MNNHAPEQAQKPKRKNEASNLLLYGIIIALIIGIVGVSLFIVVQGLTGSDDSLTALELLDVEDFDGATPINPPHKMTDFTLTSQNGEPVSLSDLRGKYVLLTFGYTHCPDVCPLTLNEFRNIKKSLNDLAEQVEFVFISVDGERDTPQVLAQYFENRKLEGFVGMTGDADELKQIGVDYGLFFEKGESTSQGGYIMSHTAGSYLLDRAGRWIMRYQFGVRPGLIVDDLKEFLLSD